MVPMYNFDFWLGATQFAEKAELHKILKVNPYIYTWKSWGQSSHFSGELVFV